MWIKNKCLCKGDVRRGMSINHGNGLKTIFIKDKYYDVSFKLWSEDMEKNRMMIRLNGGYESYSVVNENGTMEYLSRAEFNIIFHDKDALRDILIDEIIDGTQIHPH